MFYRKPWIWSAFPTRRNWVFAENIIWVCLCNMNEWMSFIYLSDLFVFPHGPCINIFLLHMMLCGEKKVSVTYRHFNIYSMHCLIRDTLHSRLHGHGPEHHTYMCLLNIAVQNEFLCAAISLLGRLSTRCWCWMKVRSVFMELALRTDVWASSFLRCYLLPTS